MSWFDEDQFWIDLQPFLFPGERLANAPREVEAILKLCGADVRTALDLCCGPGRHAMALAGHGIEVTAVDRTAPYLEQARRQARAEGLDIEWVQEDMRAFVRPGAFDLVLNMFTSFGYFDDEEDNRLVLRQIHRSLRSGGALFMDMVGKEWLAENFVETTTLEGPDGSVLYERHRIEGGWRGVRNDWTIVKDGVAKTWSFRHTLYSGSELADLLSAAGFTSVSLLGNLEGEEYGYGSERLIAAAWK